MYTVLHIFTMAGGLFKKERERETTNKTKRYCYVFLPIVNPM